MFCKVHHLGFQRLGLVDDLRDLDRIDRPLDCCRSRIGYPFRSGSHDREDVATLCEIRVWLRRRACSERCSVQRALEGRACLVGDEGKRHRCRDSRIRRDGSDRGLRSRSGHCPLMCCRSWIADAFRYGSHDREDVVALCKIRVRLPCRARGEHRSVQRALEGRGCLVGLEGKPHRRRGVRSRCRVCNRGLRCRCSHCPLVCCRGRIDYSVRSSGSHDSEVVVALSRDRCTPSATCTWRVPLRPAST